MANKIVGVLREQVLRDTLSEALEAELATLSWERPAGRIKQLYEKQLQRSVA